jgi:hypothetical protein
VLGKSNVVETGTRSERGKRWIGSSRSQSLM